MAHFMSRVGVWTINSLRVGSGPIHHRDLIGWEVNPHIRFRYGRQKAIHTNYLVQNRSREGSRILDKSEHIEVDDVEISENRFNASAGLQT
jgi:hypothetical protein